MSDSQNQAWKIEHGAVFVDASAAHHTISKCVHMMWCWHHRVQWPHASSLIMSLGNYDHAKSQVRRWHSQMRMLLNTTVRLLSAVGMQSRNHGPTWGSAVTKQPQMRGMSMRKSCKASRTISHLAFLSIISRRQLKAMTYMQRPSLNCRMIRNLPVRSQVRLEDLQADAAKSNATYTCSNFHHDGRFFYLVCDGTNKSTFASIGFMLPAPNHNEVIEPSR